MTCFDSRSREGCSPLVTCVSLSSSFPFPLSPLMQSNNEDAMCLFGSCFNKNTFDSYRKRVQSLEGGWE